MGNICSIARLNIACPVIAEKRSIIIIAGIKYFALIGIGKKVTLICFQEKNIPNATKIPIIAPDAPTIVELKFEKLTLLFQFLYY